jgi:general secretion pathway protein J
MIRREGAGEAGFTLVELLIAVTLLTLLMTLVFGGTRLAARAWSKADQRAVSDADLWAVETLLRRTITSAYPGFASADPSDRTVAFDGGSEALALVAPLPAAIAEGVEAQQRFFVLAEGQSQALFIGWRLDLPDAAENAQPEQRVRLLDRVRKIRFDYYGAPDQSQGPQWLQHWSGYARLPELVRVHIERENSALPEWPDLLVETKTTMNSACIYDAVAANCRRIR